MANLSPLLEEQTPAHYEIKFIEIIDDTKSGSRKIRSGAMPQDEVGEWLKGSSINSEMVTTKIIFSIPAQKSQASNPSPLVTISAFDSTPELADQNDDWLRPRSHSRRSSFQPTQISEPARQTMNAVMSFPPSYARILHRGLGASLRFATQTGSGGFILQCRPVGEWHFSLAVTTNRSGTASQVFVHGLQEHEYVALAGALDDPEYHQISARLILPLFLIGKRAERAADALRDCVLSLKQTQQYLEDDKNVDTPSNTTKANNSTNVTGSKEKDWLFGLDLRETTSSITHLSSELAFYKAESRVGLAMLKVLESTCTGTSENLEVSDLGPVQKVPNCMEMMNIQELNSYFHSMDTEAERYGRSADAQRQTVYALIAQKDNMLNMQTTEASLHIAESSRVESNAMKVIAQSTAEDSASMSVITTITIVFLPGTFTATFFSTTFFNFQPQSSSPGHHVSPWLWLYWCVTILLTTLIIATWWFFARRRQQRIEKSLAHSDLGPETTAKAGSTLAKPTAHVQRSYDWPRAS